MPRLTLLAALSIACALAPPAWAQDPAAQLRPMQAQGHDPAECFCRANGTTFAVGESTCLRTSEGPRIAECGMVLNNTSWRFTQRPCPES